jgi:hypothetical protein
MVLMLRRSNKIRVRSSNLHTLFLRDSEGSGVGTWYVLTDMLAEVLPRRCECLVSAMVIRTEHRLPPPESELGMFLTVILPPRCEGYPKGKHALWVYEGCNY